MKPKAKAHENQHAFTVLELLLVLGVLALLLTLLLVAITQSKTKARQTQCINNLRQLGLGLQSFIANNGVFPTYVSGTNSGLPYSWAGQLERGGFDNARPRKGWYREGVWKCPSGRWTKLEIPVHLASSYGYNAFGLMPLGRWDSLGLSGRIISKGEGAAHVRESEVLSPAGMIAIGDSLTGSSELKRNPVAYLEITGFASSRHSGKANVLFCDGHVESPTLGSVFEDSDDSALVRWNRDHQSHREFLPSW